MAQIYRGIDSAKAAIANWKKEQDEKTYWESQFLEPLQTQYQQEEKTARTQAQYDISAAYANYLNYQRQLASSNLLGTTQAGLSKQAESSYASSYGKAQSSYLSAVQGAYDTYSKGLESAEKQLTKEAEQVDTIRSKADEYIESKYKDWGYTDEEFKNMYQIDPTTGTYKLTESGRQLYAKTFDDIDPTTGRSAFWEGLRKSSPEAYEYASNNYEKLANVIGEYDPNKYDVSKKTNTYDTTSKSHIGVEVSGKNIIIDGEKHKIRYTPTVRGNYFESGDFQRDMVIPFSGIQRLFNRIDRAVAGELTDTRKEGMLLSEDEDKRYDEMYYDVQDAMYRAQNNSLFVINGRKYYKDDKGVVYAYE